MAGSPSLAAQPDIFLQYQLVFMRDGVRDAGVMKAVVKNLTDENIRDLGAYYAALPPPPPFKATGQVDEQKVVSADEAASLRQLPQRGLFRPGRECPFGRAAAGISD